MPKQKPENKLTDKEQFERFKKTAREHGVDSEKADAAFSSLSGKKSGQQRPQKSGTSQS